jgi:RimJ/RimL family protein N-acetyltransferase
MKPPRISLTRPTLADRARVHGWLTTPGIVEKMMGPPIFPEIPVPDYATFCDDYVAHFWTHEAPELGRLFLIEAAAGAIGCITHNDVVVTAGGARACELDLWLAGPRFIGRGYGRAAILAICELIARELRVSEAFLQPSARNPIALAAYVGAGFSRSPLPGPEAAAFYRTRPDYADSVFLVRRLDEAAGATPPPGLAR